MPNVHSLPGVAMISDEKRRLVLRDIRRVYERHGIVLQGESDFASILTIEPATQFEIEEEIKRIR